MTNYYTPSIEEFYIGMEFELLDQTTTKMINDRKWHTVTVSPNNNEMGVSVAFNRIPQLLRRNEIRVKYLDESDLLELGWNEPYDWFVFKSYKCRFIYNGFEILTFDDSNIFNGVVKNKSELKKLMNMLKLT